MLFYTLQVGVPGVKRRVISLHPGIFISLIMISKKIRKPLKGKNNWIREMVFPSPSLTDNQYMDIIQLNTKTHSKETGSTTVPLITLGHPIYSFKNH